MASGGRPWGVWIESGFAFPGTASPESKTSALQMAPIALLLGYPRIPVIVPRRRSITSLLQIDASRSNWTQHDSVWAENEHVSLRICTKNGRTGPCPGEMEIAHAV